MAVRTGCARSVTSHNATAPRDDDTPLPTRFPPPLPPASGRPPGLKPTALTWRSPSIPNHGPAAGWWRAGRDAPDQRHPTSLGFNLSSNRSAGRPIAFTRPSLAISASSVSAGTTPGPPSAPAGNPAGRVSVLALQQQLLQLARRTVRQPVPRGLHQAHVGGQPHRQPVLVLHRRLGELVEVPDLSPMVGRLPRGEVVAGEQLRTDLHLPRHEIHA